MRCEYLAQPCRNFNIMALELVRDPRDGREKVVLGNWAGGEVGSLVFVEPASGEGETLLLPDDEGPEGLLNL